MVTVSNQNQLNRISSHTFLWANLERKGILIDHFNELIECVAWSVLLLARPHTDLTCFLMRKNVSLLITANDSMFEKCIKESELHAECEWEKIIYEFYNLAFNTIQHIYKLYTTIFASFSRCAILKKLLNNNWNARYEPSEITVMMARM